MGMDSPQIGSIFVTDDRPLLCFEGQSIFFLKILDCLLSLKTFIDDRHFRFGSFNRSLSV